MQTTYIEVRADVRYWEDATVSGTEDTDGTLMPLRKGDCWAPVIRLADGMVMDWPQGTTADVHFKVCDAGEYWLLDDERKRVAKWAGFYVPNDFLCHGDNGYGDYIILKVGADGLIEKWRTPDICVVCPCNEDDQSGWYKGYKGNGFRVTAMSLPGTSSDDGGLPGVAVQWLNNNRAHGWYPFGSEAEFWVHMLFSNACDPDDA